MRNSRAFPAAALLLVAAACSDPASPPTDSAPMAQFSAAAGQAISGRFIVTLREGVSPDAVAAEHGVRPDFVYQRALNGFAGGMSDLARNGLLRDARVLRVEQDGTMEAFGSQSNATWGLDRIDQRALPLNSTYNYTSTGSGVTAYIIDTGIRFSHNEFGGRATSGFDAVDGGSADDCNGHGTHVAGTVGGSTWGVAKGVNLVAVRVLNCSGSGSTSGVIAGIDWVTTHHASKSVANMSLGGGASASLDAAVNNSIASGVTYAIAAGNGNKGGVAQDACKYSPARVAAAITVGATDKTDTRTSWSNYGNCVDIFAPGLGITSSWYNSNTATNTISGTSMATPHVAGVVALYLQANAGTPAQVRDALVNNGTPNVVKSSKTTNPRLLFTNY
ncbi:MAG TPA: S8 family serine peptidase [Gemmatimonadales bacterium]|nr:S8 family serine peptidase [Gemmatimonadales bacterium]